MIKPLEIQIRFSDIDLMGHVNNSVYLNYFESARMHYLVSLVGTNWDWRKNGIILKTNEIEYLAPVFLTDKPFVSVFLEAIGTKSFTLAYELTVNDIIKTKGKSVLVSFDVYNSKPIEISDDFRLALTKLTKTT